MSSFWQFLAHSTGIFRRVRLLLFIEKYSECKYKYCLEYIQSSVASSPFASYRVISHEQTHLPTMYIPSHLGEVIPGVSICSVLKFTAFPPSHSWSSPSLLPCGFYLSGCRAIFWTFLRSEWPIKFQRLRPTSSTTGIFSVLSHTS